MKSSLVLILITLLGISSCEFGRKPLTKTTKNRVLVVIEKGTGSVGFYSEEGYRIKTVKIDTFPHEMVFSADNKRAYVTNNGSLRYLDDVQGGETVSVLDLENMNVIDEISLLPYGRPHGISLDPESGLLAVSVENPDKVLLIDPENKQIVKAFDNYGDTPHMILLAPGGKQLFIANTLSNDLVITDVETGEHTKIAVGKTPQGMVLDQTRQILFVSCVNYTSVIDLIKKEEIHQIQLGANRLELTQNDSLLLLSSSNKGVGFVDAYTFEILYHLDLGYRPFSLNVSSDEQFAYVAAEEQNLIFVVAIDDRRIIRKFRTPEENRPDPVKDIWIGSEIVGNKSEASGSKVPEFERLVVDSTFTGGYQIKSADVNGDGLEDLIAVSARLPEIFWYENPSWEKHLVSDQTKGNIDLAPKDIDRDGLIDIALASRFDLNNSTQGGYVYWLQNLDSGTTWKLHYIDSIPTSHRIRWADLNGDLNQELVNVPIIGIGAQKPEYAVGAELSYYRVPRDPVNSPWMKRVIDTAIHMAHGVQMVRWDRDLNWSVLTASFEGVQLYRYENLDGKDSWTKTQIGMGDTGPRPGRGSSEVGFGYLGNEKRAFIATIEPWHGDKVVYYAHGVNDQPWDRHVIDTSFQDGHALICADFDLDGGDEIIAGHRGPDYNLYLYQFDAESGQWTRHDLDKGGMSAAGLCLLDFDSDGFMDIAACGSATHNVVLYRNVGK